MISNINCIKGEAWINSPARMNRDRILASACLAGSMPMLAGIGIVHRLQEEPGLIYNQERVGRHLARFTMYKFRGLPSGTPIGTGHGVYDDRASGLGSVLRKTGIDELPQLVNVIKGEMALFGPRACIPEDMEKMQQILNRKMYDQ